LSNVNESKKTSLLKRLSGGDSIRYEKKFSDVSSFENTGLVFITSNVRDIYTKGSDYCSIKRRFHPFHINKSIDLKEMDPDILENILKKDFLKLMLLAILHSDNIKGIRNSIKN
jgi:phage/plasmid-associated DNA primase